MLVEHVLVTTRNCFTTSHAHPYLCLINSLTMTNVSIVIKIVVSMVMLAALVASIRLSALAYPPLL